MGWLFVPGLADSSSELNWPSEMPIGLSVAWNGKALQPRSWSRVSKIAAFRRFLSGLTFDPSTADAGVESWISSLRDSRASHSAWPDFDGEPKTRATSGPTSPASSESVSPESSSLKTFRGCSQLGLPMGDMPTSTSSPIYEDWVTKLRLASSRRRKSAPLTSANGSSSWPTAQSHDSQGPKSPEQIAAMRANGYGVRNLNEEVAMWPTPVANDDNKTPEAHLAKKPGRTVVTSLNIVASQMWPTPRSEDSESAGNHPGATDSLTGATGNWATPNWHDGRRPGADIHSTQGANLNRDAALWQTPASDSFRSRGGDRKDEMGLDQQARTMWSTPQEQDHKQNGDRPNSHAVMLIQQARRFPQALQTESDGQPSSGSAPTSRRQLNPVFVEWLMGWPAPGWTSLAPLGSGSPGMAFCHWRQLMRFELSQLGWQVPGDNC